MIANEYRTKYYCKQTGFYYGDKLVENNCDRNRPICTYKADCIAYNTLLEDKLEETN